MMSRWCGAALACATLIPVGLAGQGPPPIADNSFLLEEAYNQEAGVVQHISALWHARRSSWAYAFTQEWPLGGQRHQGSYTVPIEGGLGDVALNYRHQLGGGDVALAPRLSLLLPTGDSAQGYGSGALGVQVNLPISWQLAPMVVTHWNAGVTATPALDQTSYTAGASVIVLLRPTVNLMLELAWQGAKGVPGELIVNPGVRWAHNLGSLQIVPGISFPLEHGVFFYLSFEHPFKSSAPPRAP